MIQNIVIRYLLSSNGTIRNSEGILCIPPYTLYYMPCAKGKISPTRHRQS